VSHNGSDMDRHCGFFESDRLAREAQREHTRVPAMVMCPTCNRSIPEGVPCMVCEPLCNARNAKQAKDKHSPAVW
jgi:hypothetical protein